MSEEELVLLEKRLKLISEELRNNTHKHQKELVLFAIRMFFLELSTIIEEGMEETSNEMIVSRDEIYFQKFLDLLASHYKKEHLVDFYAQSLNITSHYLTVIVKRLTGQTVSEIIFQLIFSEAKLLLQNPDMTIQQIAEQLYFSDQSAFGKFFKRKSGLSPKSYREAFI